MNLTVSDSEPALSPGPKRSIFETMTPQPDSGTTSADVGDSMRTFATGATRNTDQNKIDFEGFLSPMVLRRYAEYMHGHRRQADGTIRSSDNWQRGIPVEVYMSSLWRHFMDVWSLHRGIAATSPETGEPVEIVEAIMACLFNLMGYAHELLNEPS